MKFLAKLVGFVKYQRQPHMPESNKQPRSGRAPQPEASFDQRVDLFQFSANAAGNDLLRLYRAMGLSG